MLTPFEEVMSIRSLSAPEPEEVEIIGSEPILSTKFRIGTTAAAVLAGIGVAANDIWEMKTGRRQKVKVNMRHTAAALRSSNYLQRPDGNGGWENCVNRAHEDMIAITQPWPTKDGRWFLPHFGLPHLQKRVLNLLGAEPNPKSVAAAVSRHDAIELEQAIDEIRACGAMVRLSLIHI